MKPYFDDAMRAGALTYADSKRRDRAALAQKQLEMAGKAPDHCTVCMRDLDFLERNPLHGDFVVYLTCGHETCGSCVKRLRQNNFNVCPVCKDGSDGWILKMTCWGRVGERADEAWKRTLDEVSIAPPSLCCLHTPPAA
jgi:hypothetical protein